MSNRMLNVERIPDNSLSEDKMSSTFNNAVNNSIVNCVKVIGIKGSARGLQYIYLQSLIPLEGKKITFARYITAIKTVYAKKSADGLGRRTRTTKKTRKWTLVPAISTDATSKGWGGSLGTRITLQLQLEKQPSQEYPYYLYSLVRKECGDKLTPDVFIGMDDNNSDVGFFVSFYDLDSLTFRWRWGKSRKIIDDYYKGRVQFKAGFDIDGVIVPFTMQALIGHPRENVLNLYTCIV